MNTDFFSLALVIQRWNRHKYSHVILERSHNLIHSRVVLDVGIITSIFNQVVCNLASRTARSRLLTKVKRDVAACIIFCFSHLNASAAIECPISERILLILAVDPKGELLEWFVLTSLRIN